jgi:hypothetical protein
MWPWSLRDGVKLEREDARVVFKISITCEDGDGITKRQGANQEINMRTLDSSTSAQIEEFSSFNMIR